MGTSAFKITTEIRKFLKEKPTKVEPAILLGLIAEDYLEMLKEGRRKRDVDELFRLHRLEDPRGEERTRIDGTARNGTSCVQR